MNAYMDGSVLIVKIEKSDNFVEALDKIKSTFLKEDREYNDNKKCWVIKNPQSYAHVPFVQNALRDFKSQLSLF